MKQEQRWQLLTTEWSKHDKSLLALLLGRLNIYLDIAIKNFCFKKKKKCMFYILPSPL